MKKWQAFISLGIMLVAGSGSALYAELPAAGADRFDAIMEMALEVSHPRLGPDPAPFRLFLTGPVVVQRSDPLRLGGGEHLILTEILSMELTGADQVLGPEPNPFKVKLVESPTAASTGEIRTSGRSLEGASSFFDLFFEIQIGDLRFRNDQPVRLEAGIDAFPPLENTYFAAQLPIPLVETGGPDRGALGHVTQSVPTTHVPGHGTGQGSVQFIKFIPTKPSHSTQLKLHHVVINLLLELAKHLNNVTISGTVTLNGSPQSGLLVFAGKTPSNDGSTALTPASKDTTDANGFYSFIVPKGSSGAIFVVPPPGFCSISPPSVVQTFNQNLVQDFSITCQ